MCGETECMPVKLEQNGSCSVKYKGKISFSVFGTQIDIYPTEGEQGNDNRNIEFSGFSK
jgi:hypothetical protein